MMTRRRFIFLLLIFPLLFISSAAFSYAQSKSGEKILVLYKERDPGHKGIISFFTGFLEQAGYDYDTRDIEALLVGEADMTSYSGIMTCYQTSKMINGDLYPSWLLKQMEAGRRILIIGNYGAYQGLIKKRDGSFVEWNESTMDINTFFYPFGLEFYFAFTNDPKKIRLLKADWEYAQFQTTVTFKDLTYYNFFKSVNANNKIFFELERTDMENSASALNVITPFGGMIMEGYSYYWDPEKKKTVLRVNFPEFIRDVFSADSPPVPKYEVRTHSELLEESPLPERSLPENNPALKPSEMRRRILVPYKKSEVKNIKELPFFNRAALILEYLGMIPVYRAVEEGLPDDDAMESFLGIVSWHTTPYMHEAQKYGKWLLRQIKNNKKVVILQEYGATYDLETQKPVSNQSDVFEALGVRFVMRDDVRQDYLPEVRFVDTAMLGFERAFNPSKISFTNTYTSVDPRNEVFLSYNDREFGQVDLGIITPYGGISMAESPFYSPAHDAERIKLIRKAFKGEVAPEVAEQQTLGAWLLNPYRFFSQALGLDDFPAPDVTTLNGSRIFYSHIDGDGLESVSLIDRAQPAGFFVYEEILKKYKDIPVTVSVITKPIEKLGNAYYRPSVELSRHIFALPNVDVAIHSATHPFDWVGGDPYITNPGNYPYKIGHKSPDLLEEIWGSKLFAEYNLTPPGKKVETLFWSGATNPDSKALHIAWRAGIHNLNGGDPRYDNEYPFLEGLSPYSLPNGSLRQYFTSAQNDYIYSLFLTGDWGGQKKVVKHFEKTDRPYRVYPMNLYYHFYSGIKRESLDALHHVYDYIHSIDAASISATQYLEIIEDYYNTRTGFDGQSYWVENNGFLRTMRFDGILHVDMVRSKGVIGYSHYNNQTYVHLDGSHRREISFSQSPPQTPYFIQATQFIDQYAYDDPELTFIYRGFGKTVLKIGGLAANTAYRLILEAPERENVNTLLMTNEDGELEYRAQLPPPSATYDGVLKRVRQ